MIRYRLLFRSVVATIMIVALLSNCYAFADVFSVRKGISFGMNKDEILKIEKENGYTGSPRDGTYKEIGDQYLTLGFKNLLNLQDGLLVYRFKNGKMYCIGFHFDGDGTVRTFDSIDEALSIKYGAPTCDNKVRDISPFTEKYVIQAINELSDSTQWQQRKLSLKQWVVGYDDCYSCITLLLGTNHNTILSKDYYDCYLTYTYISLEDYQNSITNMQTLVDSL